MRSGRNELTLTAAVLAVGALALLPAEASAGVQHVAGYSYPTQATSAPGSSGELDLLAQCAGGRHVLNGGFYVTSNTSPYLIGEDSAPFDNIDLDSTPDNGWYIGSFANPNDQPVAAAVCGKQLPSYRTRVKTETDLQNHIKIHVGCPNKTEVVGGGEYSAVDHSSGDPGLEQLIQASYPYDDGDQGRTPDDGWATTSIRAGDAGMITGFAICVKDITPRYKLGGANIMNGSNATAVASCPAGTHVIGGGYHPERTGGSDILESFPNDVLTTPGWTVQATRFAGNTSSMLTYAVCV